MVIELASWTSVVSLVIFILALFGAYRALIGAKDATIESLKERIAFLECKLEEATASQQSTELPKQMETLTAKVVDTIQARNAALPDLTV